jgi:hypothetical protein
MIGTKNRMQDTNRKGGQNEDASLCIDHESTFRLVGDIGF